MIAGVPIQMMITLKCSMTIMWWNYCRTNWTYFRDIRRKDASVLVIKIRSSVQQYHHDYRFRNFLSVNIFLHHFVSRESRDNNNISSIETLLKKIHYQQMFTSSKLLMKTLEKGVKLHKKWSYYELFWSVFSPNAGKYGPG